MKETILSINQLSKHYGRIRAVDNLSLDIERGNVYGILGPNGSGKTTTIGIILGVINANSGSYKWFGNEPTNNDRKRIGSIIETPLFYPYLTAIRNLKIIADIKGLGYESIENVLKTVDLFERKNDVFKTYSLGMKQRLALAAAMLGNPEMMILDEPTNGLDPQGIADTRDLIKRIASEGTTIFLASHLLDEVQKVCTHVAVLNKGKKLFSGDVDEVLTDTFTIEIASDNLEELQKTLNDFPNLHSVTKDGDKLTVRVKGKTNGRDLNSFLFNKGIILTHLAAKKKSLESYFLELLSDKK